MEALARRVTRFGVAGAFTTGAYLALTFGFSRFDPSSPVWASIVAYLLCIVLSFVLQKHFAFRAGGAVRFEFPRFALASLVGLLLSTGIVAAGVAAQLPPWFCYLAVALLVAPLSFLLLDRVVFVFDRRG